jgi:hypothetical protein
VPSRERRKRGDALDQPGEYLPIGWWRVGRYEERARGFRGREIPRDMAYALNQFKDLGLKRYGARTTLGRDRRKGIRRDRG